MAASAHGSLTANVVKTVTITPGPDGIEIVNRDQTGSIWVRTDGQDPAIEGVGSFVVLGARTFPQRTRGADLTVKMLAAVARNYSVEAI